MKKIKILAIALVTVIGICSAFTAKPNFKEQDIYCNFGGIFPREYIPGAHTAICMPAPSHCREFEDGTPVPGSEGLICIAVVPYE